jgi:hypothetical protein
MGRCRSQRPYAWRQAYARVPALCDAPGAGLVGPELSEASIRPVCREGAVCGPETGVRSTGRSD